MAKKIARKKDAKLSGRMGSLEHNVDRIRDILFGPTMKEYEGRFEVIQAQMEELSNRLSGNQKEIVEDTKGRISALQSSLDEAVRELTGQVRDVVRAQEKLQNNIEKLLQQSLKETVTMLRREVQQDRSEIVNAIDELRQAQDEQYEELVERKIDRQDLVRLFMEFINSQAGR